MAELDKEQLDQMFEELKARTRDGNFQVHSTRRINLHMTCPRMFIHPASLLFRRLLSMRFIVSLAARSLASVTRL